MKTFKGGIVENIPNLVKRISTNRINPKKSTPKRVMIKRPKTIKTMEKILKATRGHYI